MTLWKRPPIITALVLLIPLSGDLFDDDWDWGVRAFLLAGSLVFGASLTYELATRSGRPLAPMVAPGMSPAMVLNGVFVALFALSGLLFVKAARST